jgi:hypothetical protein
MVTGMAHGARGEGKTADDAVRGRMLRNAVTSPTSPTRPGDQSHDLVLFDLVDEVEEPHDVASPGPG